MPKSTQSKGKGNSATSDAATESTESGRITTEQVEAEVQNLNTLFNAPTEPYQKNEDGSMVPQVGNFHLDRQKGGFAVRRVEKGGALRDALGCGFQPKRAILNYIRAYIRGHQDATASKS